LEVKTTKQQPAYSLPDINIYFLKLGTLVFGGLEALVAYMQHDLVETKGWLTEET